MALTLIQKLTVWIIPLTLAITLHEAAHAWAASLLGDHTAKRLGRLSMNPIRHIDLFGTILLPILIAVLSQFQFVFGWAKPVPVNWTQLRNPRRDSALVALAGPTANLVMALLWASVLKITFLLNPQHDSMALWFLLLTAQAGILVNLIIGLLNLLPIPPLDGSRLVASVLPPRQANLYMKIEPFGFFILLGLLVSGMLSRLLAPLFSASLQFIRALFQL